MIISGRPSVLANCLKKHSRSHWSRFFRLWRKPSAHLATKYDLLSITMQNAFKCVFHVSFQHLHVELLFCFVPFNPPLNSSIFLATTKTKCDDGHCGQLRQKQKVFLTLFFKGLSSLDSGILDCLKSCWFFSWLVVFLARFFFLSCPARHKHIRLQKFESSDFDLETQLWDFWRKERTALGAHVTLYYTIASLHAPCVSACGSAAGCDNIAP